MVGKMISRYRIVSKLSGGGLGIVYKAEDTKLNRPVALKVLPQELSAEPYAKDRFIEEAQAVTSLTHPNICALFDFGETDDGMLFVVMEYCHGENLRKRLEKGLQPPAEALDIAIQLSRGLAVAHARGFVHRDISPSNVFISKNGVAKLLDFGMEKLADRSLHQRPPVAFGAPEYLAPEQITGSEVDKRADLWAMGVLLFEMLTGTLPFRGENVQSLYKAICDEPHAPMTAAGVSIPRQLQNIVTKLLYKEPAWRYQNAEELVSDLEAVRIQLQKKPGVFVRWLRRVRNRKQ